MRIICHGNYFRTKIKAILNSPDADILKEFIDLLYYRQEEYDEDPLSEEDLQAIQEGEEDFRQILPDYQRR
jgi:hypothetical protein